ncbi:MAG: DNA polymerase IV [Kiloniellales bacterium]
MPTLCRDCGDDGAAASPRCPACGSPRLIAHPELDTLTIAHVDCDAFYAAIEKRDDPALSDRPVIVGGGRRGVVAACCYVARLYGVHSAMPMFKALKACPDATVIAPDMAKYQRVGREVRSLLRAATPLVEPLSVDEAFLDLGGTERLHGGAPARTLALLIKRIEDGIGITASVGLSYNKFLAKVASDLDKPRGFAVIGRAEALDFLADKPVSLIWGVGRVLRRRLEADGLGTLGRLRQRPETELVARYGAIGRRLARFARGEDDRAVEPNAAPKSLSSETTLDDDIADPERLASVLWPLCEKLARRLKQSRLAASTVSLKLKTADFRLLTRSRRLTAPTQLAETLYRTARPLLQAEADGTRFRLIGIGAADLANEAEADPPDLLDPGLARRMRAEQAINEVRAKLGQEAIVKGRALSRPPADRPPRR